MFGSFGQASASTSTPAASAGFGFPSATPAAAPVGGSLFGAPKPAAPAGGLFGSAPTAAAPASGGMFGSTPAAPATGGLFGSTPAATMAAQAAGGLFGSMSAAPAAPASGGLFGSAPAAAAPATWGSLFGAPPAAAAPASGGFFGSAPAAPAAAAPSGGLFGSTAAAPAPSSSLFGAPAAAAPAATGNALFGKPAAPAPAAAGPVTKATKFSDLPEGIQKAIEQMDMYFKEQKAIGAGIDTETVGGAIWQTSGDVKVASDENEALTQGLYALKQSLDVLGAKVAAETADLTRLVETWEAARPQPHGAIRPVTRDFAQDYFSRVANGLDERVARYKRNIALLTRAVTSLANEQDTLSPQVVAQTIRNNQQAIMALAAQLEQLSLRLSALRANFTDEYRERTNSMRDPFEVAREVKGLPVQGVKV